MGDIHHLNTDTNTQARLLEQWITSMIATHPDEEVAQRWLEMAKDTARKFPGPPTPTQTEIDLSHIDSMSDEDKSNVLNEVERFMSGYFDDVRQQLMQVHTELLTLQKTVAELEVANLSRP